MPNLPSSLHELTIEDKVEESVEAIGCHDKPQNSLGSHPLIQELGVKVVGSLGVSSPLVDSPATYARKKKRLIKELDRLASNINYGGKVSKRVGKVLDEDS